MNRFVLITVMLLTIVWMSAPARAQETYDVVVYGGTGSGVIAAAQAGRMGKRVVLIESSQHIGGVTSGGLTATDMGNRQSIGGVTREYYQRMLKYYQDPKNSKYVTFADYAASHQGKNHLAPDALFAFEPHVAERMFDDMAAEAKVVVVKGERLDLKDGVKKEGAKIVSIRMESGKTFAGKMFIDATYEGDLMAKAGVAYTVGRESTQQYGEKAAGIHVYTGRSSMKPIDPYIKPGDQSSGVIPNVEAGEFKITNGAADKRVQAYNYRLCLTQVAENRIPFEKPADYDEGGYELLFRLYEAGASNFPLNPVAMPCGKTDTNNNGVFSTDYVGMSAAYPEADYATRDRIAAAHVKYIKGLLWTLANHPRVPASVRAQAAKWGYARDEFTDNGNFPWALYVREARRMVGRYVMTEQDVQGHHEAPEPVALGSYTMDCHMTRRLIDKDGYLRGDGGLPAPRGFAPYGISYQSLTPKAEECTNLLVPVCLSSSHAAYGSIRMEPVYMMLGEASATAAALAIDAGVTVQEVPYEALRKRLLEGGARIEWPLHSFAGLRSKQLPGVAMDDTQAERIGKWSPGGAAAGVDGHYQHDGNDAKGKLAARFVLRVPAAGQYEVRLAYVPNRNRASNVPVIVQSEDGKKTLTVDERKNPPIDKTFVSLGQYRFTPDKDAVITVRNDNTDGYVVIDAVQLLPVK
jgi:hypothetical protein